MYDVLHCKLTKDKLNIFIKNYVKIIKNKKNRHFPRTSKTPFTKWYLKGYSASTTIIRILEAITTNTVDKLNKNLKLKASKIKITSIIVHEPLTL